MPVSRRPDQQAGPCMAGDCAVDRSGRPTGESVSTQREKAGRRLNSRRLVQTSPQRQQTDGLGQGGGNTGREGALRPILVTVKTPGNAPFKMCSLVKFAQQMKNQSYMGHLPRSQSNGTTNKYLKNYAQTHNCRSSIFRSMYLIST